MAKSVLHPLGMSSKLLEDSSYLNWKCHVTNLLLQVTYLAPHVCPIGDKCGKFDQNPTVWANMRS